MGPRPWRVSESVPNQEKEPLPKRENLSFRVGHKAIGRRGDCRNGRVSYHGQTAILVLFVYEPNDRQCRHEHAQDKGETDPF